MLYQGVPCAGNVQASPEIHLNALMPLLATPPISRPAVHAWRTPARTVVLTNASSSVEEGAVKSQPVPRARHAVRALSQVAAVVERK